MSSRHSTVNEMNYHILQVILTNYHIYKSIDTVVDRDEIINDSTEFLNILEPQELSPHQLGLKVRAPIIFIGNLDQPRLWYQLVNVRLMLHVIEASIFTGCVKGDVFYSENSPDAIRLTF